MFFCVTVKIKMKKIGFTIFNFDINIKTYPKTDIVICESE